MKVVNRVYRPTVVDAKMKRAMNMVDQLSRSRLANAGGSSIEPLWLGHLFRHFLRELSSASRILTRFGYLPSLLAILNLVSFANALPEVPSGLEPFPAEVPLSLHGLASMISTAVIYTSLAAFMSCRTGTRTRSLMLFGFLQLLAYITSLGAQDGQWMWLLWRFL